jgi:hypothetical protein
MEKPVNIPAPPAADCHGGTPAGGRNAALDMPRQGRPPAKKSPVARTAGVRTANRHRSVRMSVLR